MIQSSLDRRTFLAALGSTMAAASMPLAAAESLTLDEIIWRNTAARGGAAALDRMHSVGIDVEIVEGGTTLDGHYAATKSGLVRIDVYAAGKLDGSEGVDANGVWILGKNGPQASVATGANNALKHGAENHLFGWNRFPQRGHKLALMPPETISGLIFQVIEIRYSTGHVSYFYVDPRSWLAVRRRDERAYHPDASEKKQRVETHFSDFKEVDGVVAAHLNEDFDIDTGKLLSTSRLLSRRINPPLPSNYFDRDRRGSPTW